ncbi:MAG: DUF362 domain-containing protein [Candidatus Atribacteria bacterium]|nr:DUF362 domain-containing protein [Candidatus Atribacteria bacterium]
MGESTFGNYHTTHTCFQQTGFLELTKTYHLPLFNFNQSESIRVPVPHPLVLESIPIAREYFAVDTIINIPVMKVHYATGITLALKNLKGFLPPEEKKHFHEIGLDQAIVDLNNTITTHLTIIDAIQGMEKMGPHGGDPVLLNLVMAGEKNWEVDYVGMKIMGYSLPEVRHLQYYLESNGISAKRIEEIEILGEPIESVRYPFKKVTVDTIIPCTFLEGPPISPIDIFLGSLLPDPLPANPLRLSFGNCCLRQSHSSLSIPGCPPYPFELNSILKRNLLMRKK